MMPDTFKPCFDALDHTDREPEVIPNMRSSEYEGLLHMGGSRFLVTRSRTDLIRKHLEKSRIILKGSL